MSHSNIKLIYYIFKSTGIMICLKFYSSVNSVDVLDFFGDCAKPADSAQCSEKTKIVRLISR